MDKPCTWLCIDGRSVEHCGFGRASPTNAMVFAWNAMAEHHRQQE
jgi:hypothetical protein